MAKSKEPMFWSLFAAGMMVTAMLAPVLIFLTGIAGPLDLIIPGGDWFSYARLHALTGHIVTRLFLFAFVMLALFVWAHRFRFTLYDIGVSKGKMALAVLCYGSAIAGTVAAIVVLW